jgi:predicted RNA-binding protein with PIN domain
VKWLIDGYNLLFSAGAQKSLRSLVDSQDLEAARDLLVARVAEHAVRRGETAVIVFDGSPQQIGAPREEVRHGLRCLYSIGEGKADRRLLALLDDEARPGECVVVSSDREVKAGARRRGAPVMGADAFWREATARPNVEKPGAKDRPLSAGEVDEWMRYFGFEEGD